MIAGTLEIQMLAQLARLTKDMQDAKRIVGASVKEIESLARRASGALSAIGAGVSTAGLVLLSKHTIDALDALNDLNKSTAIGVRDLSGLSYAAKVSGANLEEAAKAINKLSQNIGKDSEKYRRLGITAKEPLEAFKQLSDIFRGIEDPQLRAAVAAEALGKSWAGAAGLLDEGGDRIGEMIEKGKELSGVTEEMVRQADEFNDKLTELAGSGTLTNAVIGPMLPLLIKAAEDLISLRDSAVTANVGFNPFVETLRALIVVAGNVGFVVRGIALELGGMAAQIQAMLSGDFARVATIGQMMEVDAIKRRQAFDEWEKGIMNVGAASEKAAPSVRLVSEETERKARAFVTATKAAKDMGLSDEHVVAYMKHMIELAKLNNEEFDKALELDEARLKATNDAIKSVREYAEQLEFETSIMGLSNAEREKAIALRALEKAGIDISTESVARLVNRIRDQVAIQDALRDQASVWDQLSDAAGNFFSDLMTSGRGAFDNLRRWVKQLLADMVALFAKRWVLNLAAGGTMLGSAGSALAGGAGGGTIPGAGLGWLLPSGELGAAVGNFASMGASMFGAGGSLASTIGSVASFLPAIGAAVSVAAMLYSAFNDGPENPNFRWFQGTGGQGGFGGISSSGNYNFDSSGLMRYVGGLDARFASILGASGTAAATAGLAAYTQGGLRMDGLQPAQFAFPEGTDREAAEQLAKELLQSRYGTIFAAIDSGIAEQIRAFSGTSSELQAFIETALGVVEGLSGLGVNGLDVGTLQLMQREGEDLGATFNRVAGQWSNFTQLFTTEAERLTAAQDLVSSTFANLGIAIPASKDEFEALVRGLDLSTESGRSLFTALMQVAPAFAAVEDASASMMQSFYSLMGQMRGAAYTSSITQGLLQSSVQTFMGQNAWTQGMSWQEVAAAFGTITAEDFAAYSTANQQLILEILGYQNQLDQAGQETSTYTAAVGGATSAVDSFANAIAQARSGIAEWLQRIFVSDASPLTPQERLNFSQGAYVENLLKAQAGDASALAAYTGLADAYLREAQSFWASSPEYRAIFEAVTGQAKGLTGLEDTAPPNRRDARDNADRIERAVRDVESVIRDLGNGTIALNRTTEQVVRAVETLNRTQVRAVRDQTRDLISPLGV